MIVSATHTQNRKRLRVSLLAFALAIVAAASMLDYEFGLLLPSAEQSRVVANMANGYFFGNDFYPLWLAARETRNRHTDLYSPEMTRAVQTGLFGRPMDPRNKFDPPIGYREFAYPAFTEILLWPSALLDFPHLRWLLLILLPLLTIVALWFWLQALEWYMPPLWFGILVLLTFTSYQTLEALFAEQPGLLVAFFLAATAFALKKGRLLLAGTFAALTLIKPQMTLLAIVYLLFWSFSDGSRARFWQSFCAVSLALLTASLWIWPHWIGEWLRTLLGYHNYATPPLIIVLLGSVLARYVGVAVIAAALTAALMLSWRKRWLTPYSQEFWFIFAILLAITSITLLPGQAVYDHLILIPAILLIVQYRKNFSSAGKLLRLLLAIGVLVLSWQWMAAFLLLSLRLVSQNARTSMLSLPIRSATPLPFVVLFLAERVRRFIASQPKHA